MKRAEFYVFVDKYKLDSGCALCGYNKFACALDFHHKDREEKLFCIGRGVHGGIDFLLILEEMDKCEVLCKNCHSVVSRTRTGRRS